MAGDKSVVFQKFKGGPQLLLSTGERSELGELLSAQDEVAGWA